MISTVKRILLFFTFFILISYSEGYFVANIAADSLDESVEDFYSKKNEEKEKDENLSPQPDANTESDQLSITFVDGLQMIFALIFVIAILYFLLRFINKRSQSFQQNRLIQNIGGTSLGGNKSIQIVKVGNQLFIVGVGEDITLLKEITDKEEYEAYLLQHNEQLEKSLQPVDMFSKVLKNGMKFIKSSSENKSTTSFNMHLKGKLDEIKKERRDALNRMEKKESKQDE
ncbi:flagellar biosynthetic protein FliO [Lederbergia graminis]|uniref:Flagellar protein n=1 Tax=Lederbergia graminis TaxID=735518 RepID=A0ABW0LD71_9BACI